MGNGSLGLKLGLLSSGTDTLDSGNETSLLGLSASLGVNNDDLDLGLNISTYSSDDGTTADQHERFTTNLYFRTEMEIWIFNNMAASFHYASSNDGFDDNISPVTFDLTLIQANLGFFNIIEISYNMNFKTFKLIFI